MTTIIGVSSSIIKAGQPSGTIVCPLYVRTTGGKFTGTLSLAGPDAAKFGIISNYHLYTTRPLNMGIYEIDVIATEDGAAGSPYSQTVLITVSGVTITGLNISDNTTVSNPPAGTVVGTISAATNGGPFTGTFSLGGSNAADFTINNNELITVGQLPAGNYSIDIIATQPYAAGSPFTQTETIVVPAISTDLTLQLTFADGTNLTFVESDAVDLGDYVGPFVSQKCLRQRAPATGDYRSAFIVFFRPDSNGERQEIIVEYGSEFKFTAGYNNYRKYNTPPTTASGIAPSHILAPYTATISGGSIATPITINVPFHWWGARWRWQSATRSIVRTYADLINMKAVLPLSSNAVWNASPTPTVKPFSPMGISSIDPGMGDTGDRDEIGFITEYDASYLINNDSTSLNNVLTVAEVMGSVPIWVRDMNTSAPLNVQIYPYLAQQSDAESGGSLLGPNQIPGCYNIPSENGSAWLQTLPLNQSDSFISADAAHFPPLSYVAWLLTDDPWHLEGCQMESLFDITAANYWTINLQLPGLGSISQPRAWAWSLRTIARMAAFCPSSPPSWLLPQSYWKQCLDNNLSCFSLAVNNQSLFANMPTIQQLHMFPNEGGYITSSFMIDYLMIVLGWMGWSGLFSEWQNAINWLSAPRITWTADPSLNLGWDRRWPIPYSWIPTNPITATVTWADIWLIFQTDSNAPRGTAWGEGPSSWTPDVIVPGQNLGYVTEARAALAALQLASVSEAQAEHTWVFNQLVAVASKVPASYKWAIWPN